MELTIKQYRENLRGIPKAEKIREIEQELTNRGLSRMPIPGENKSREVIQYSPSDQELEKLKTEIENNYEAYQSETKRKELIPFIYDRDLNWYFNEKNIPAQVKLVLPTYEYFNEGPGKVHFEAIDFFNLLNNQYEELVKNISKPFDVLSNLKSIPLTDRERHTLYGFIIMWFGGYPVNNLNEQYNIVLKLIEREFLGYGAETPEKEFCKADIEQRKKFMKWGIALTTGINHNIDAGQILEAMDSKKPAINDYQSFDALFEAIFKDGLLGELQDKQTYLLERSRYNFTFNVWLQDNRELEYGNEDQYKLLLTKDNFVDFLKFEHSEIQRRKFVNVTIESAYQIFQDNYNALRKSFRVKRKATKEDCKEMPRLKEGDILEFDPEYKTAIEAYTLLTEYYAKAYFELEKCQFIETYKVWNDETIKAEIEEIEKFNLEGDKVSLTEACKVYGSISKDNDLFVYKRFKGKYYENLEVSKYPMISTVGNIEARIYGRYFLFYSYLLSQLKADINSPSKAKSVKGKKNGSAEKFTQKQIAIAYFFMGEQITKDNAGKILSELSNTMSIAKLLSKRVSKASDLTGISENKTTDTKHLKDLQAAKRLITGKKNTKAAKAIDTVITAFSNTYRSKYQ